MTGETADICPKTQDMEAVIAIECLAKALVAFVGVNGM